MLGFGVERQRGERVERRVWRVGERGFVERRMRRELREERRERERWVEWEWGGEGEREG